MKTFIIETPDVELGLITLHRGYGNGYVIIPKGHPYYGKDYTDLYNIEVHGGLTYSAYGKQFNELKKKGQLKFDIELQDDDWIIGFDTAHLHDNKSNCDKKYIEKELKQLVKQLKDIT